MERVASIDIGTNTILLLIAEVEKGKIIPLVEQETIVRLGEGLQRNGFLLEEAMMRGIQTLSRYLESCRKMDVRTIFAAGTSALRDAKNSADFLKRVREHLGLAIEVISGEEEARLSFLAVSKDLKDQTSQVLVVDVGGGSTEFILGTGDRVVQWVSLPLGSVRFTEQFLRSDPVQEKELDEMKGEVRKLLSGIPHPQESPSMVAVGGTATTLASVDQGLEKFIFKKIHHYSIPREALETQLRLYQFRTVEERKKITGLQPTRADVILAGGTILHMAMESFRCPSVQISCQGVRYGLLYEKLNL